MGCTNCKSKTGCDHRKGEMMEQVVDAMERIYKTRTWGEPDDQDEADYGSGVEDLGPLADELAAELGAATFVQPGSELEPCDYIWILCMGRTPCIVQVREFGLPIPAEWTAPPDARIDELYLRMCISHRARVAAVQQVAVSARLVDGGFQIEDRPRAGVYDAPLLPRMQKLVHILPAYDLLHVDFGEIAHVPPGFQGGVWKDLYGAEPAIANYLFYPQPTTMISTAFLPV